MEWQKGQSHEEWAFCPQDSPRGGTKNNLVTSKPTQY